MADLIRWSIKTSNCRISRDEFACCCEKEILSKGLVYYPGLDMWILYIANYLYQSFRKK